MAAITDNRRAVQILNVRNRSAIPTLPDDAVVEVPCVVGGSGAHPIAVGAVPAAAGALLAQVKAVERMTIDAALTGSAELAIRAMASYPLVDSVTTARAILRGYLDRQPGLAELLH